MRLHHIGFVVSSISNYEQGMLYEEKLGEVYDPAQDARLALYSNYGSVLTELIEPASPKASTYRFLQKSGPGYHHSCYLLSNQHQVDEMAKKMSWVKIMGPTEAVLFDQDPVIFFLNRNRQIVEILVRD